jgi:hypothetical protein
VRHRPCKAAKKSRAVPTALNTCPVTPYTALHTHRAQKIIHPHHPTPARGLLDFSIFSCPDPHRQCKAAKKSPAVPTALSTCPVIPYTALHTHKAQKVIHPNHPRGPVVCWTFLIFPAKTHIARARRQKNARHPHAL